MADAETKAIGGETAPSAEGGSAQPRSGDGGVKQALSEMSPARRILFAAAGALVVGGLIALFLWINQPTYTVLFANLGQQDAAQVVAKLKDLKIDYQLESGGNAIKVREDQVYETRLALASEGLPRGGGVGFEVFNEVPMGTTEFVQRINYQRALQGELARTISSFSEVEEARVHIVLPRESLFVEEEKAPSAGVVVKLAAGRSLSKSQIAGIVHLVASAVPDLTDAHVTIVDTSGNLLYKKDADTPDFPAALTASQLEYQRNLETSLARKVESMLEQVVGPGHAVVRVAADVDFTRTLTTQDLYDPDQTAVRSETQNTEETKNEGNLPYGSPDQRFTLARENALPNEVSNGNAEANRENQTTNYEISRTQKQINQSMGGLQKLNVAVVVDGPYAEKTDADGVMTRTFQPRTAEDLQQLESIVRRAVGFNEGRGDLITMANVPFQISADAGDLGVKTWEDYFREYGRPFLNLLLVILFFLFVVRPMMKAGRQYMAERQAVRMAARAAGPAGELPPGTESEDEAALLEDHLGPKKITLRDQILALAQQDPDRAVAALRSWIHYSD